jgi:hypothetical protein
VWALQHSVIFPTAISDQRNLRNSQCALCGTAVPPQKRHWLHLLSLTHSAAIIKSHLSCTHRIHGLYSYLGVVLRESRGLAFCTPSPLLAGGRLQMGVESTTRAKHRYIGLRHHFFAQAFLLTARHAGGLAMRYPIDHSGTTVDDDQLVCATQLLSIVQCVNGYHNIYRETQSTARIDPLIKRATSQTSFEEFWRLKVIPHSSRASCTPLACEYIYT